MSEIKEFPPMDEEAADAGEGAAGRRPVPAAPPGVARKVRLAHLQQMKEVGRPIVMVTAYDAPGAALADEGGADVILVGDSVGTTVHGFETTIPVTMEMMIMHTQAVCRGSRRSLIVADMPFMSYQVGEAQAVENGGRLMKEGGAAAVKLEVSSARILPMIRALVDSGVPVVGHVGLVPQSVHALSGYRVQGRTPSEAERLMELAQLTQEAGAFSLVLELVPTDLAGQVTRALRIPTIGIGAGPQCDGQVLVYHDLVGMTESPPSFARKYVDMRAGVLRAMRKYGRDVRERLFPT